jgi:tetratricopeptide (TPR) repeat protein
MTAPTKSRLPDADAVFLALGTRILVSDIMDQMIRSLGNYRTHYAADLAWGMRTAKEGPVDVLITELELPDASAYRAIEGIRETQPVPSDVYVILAVEEITPPIQAFADELEINSVMKKPFTGVQIRAQVELFQSWNLTPDEPWRTLVREASGMVRQMNFGDAERKFRTAIDLAPTNPECLFKVARYYFHDKKDAPNAEKLLKRVLEVAPRHLPSIYMLGLIYLETRQLDNAEKCLKLSQSLSPLNPERALKLVELYGELAQQVCELQLVTDIWDTSLRLRLARLLLSKGDYRAVVREVERALPQLEGDDRIGAQQLVAVAKKLGGLAR